MYRIINLGNVENINTLNNLEKKYSKKHNQSLIICSFSNVLDFFDSISKSKYNILIISDDFCTKDCLNEVAKIKRNDYSISICLLSYDNEVAIEGYKIKAEAFFNPPITYEKIERIMDRLISTQNDIYKRDDKIMIKVGNSYSVIKYDSISYIEISGHYLVIHTDKDIYKSRGSFKTLLKTIKNSSLVRCHKSFIVNVYKITNIKNKSVYLGDTIIPLGMEGKRLLLSKLKSNKNISTFE